MATRPPSRLLPLEIAAQNGSFFETFSDLDRSILNGRGFLELAAKVILSSDSPKAKIDDIEQFFCNDPSDTEHVSAFGELLMHCGEHGLAKKVIHQAVATKETCAIAQSRLSLLLLAEGDAERSVSIIESALENDPKNADLHEIAGDIKRKLGRTVEALSHHQAARQLQPGEPRHSLKLGNIFIEDRPAPYNAVLERLFLDLMRRSDGVRYDQDYWSYAELLLTQNPKTKDLFSKAESDKKFIAYVASCIAQQPLLVACLTSFPIPNLELERSITNLRKALLLAEVELKDLQDRLFVLSMISIQCLLNDFIYAETTSETEKAAELEGRLDARIRCAEDIDLDDLLLLACYRRLAQKDWSSAYYESNREKFTSEVWFKFHFADPIQERAIAKTIPQLTKLKNNTSEIVRAMYEESPYPKWTSAAYRSNLDFYRAFRRLGLRLPEDDGFDLSNPSILVAGCGTGRTAFEYVSMTNKVVTAIDLSRASLAYGSRKQIESSCRNIEWYQADIMSLASVDRKFELIDCCGVLHHLEKPRSGLNALVNLIKPGGLFKIALYSQAARRSLAGYRKLFKNLKLENTEAGRRNFREILLKDKSAEKTLGLTKWRDFFSGNEFRDLLFHPQEHLYTVPELETLLENSGLRFLSFDFGGANQAIYQALKTQAGGGFSPESLRSWAPVEEANPDLFSSMYVFWAQKI